MNLNTVFIKCKQIEQRKVLSFIEGKAVHTGNMKNKFILHYLWQKNIEYICDKKLQCTKIKELNWQYFILIEDNACSECKYFQTNSADTIVEKEYDETVPHNLTPVIYSSI